MDGKQDIAREPVDLNSDDEFMDTGVLYEKRICVDCKDNAASSGHNKCTQCLEKDES